jgi:hypothetical protein
MYVYLSEDRNKTDSPFTLSKIVKVQAVGYTEDACIFVLSRSYRQTKLQTNEDTSRLKYS